MLSDEKKHELKQAVNTLKEMYSKIDQYYVFYFEVSKGSKLIFREL